MIRHRLATLARFLARVLAKSRRDEIILRSSALAFSTVIAAVPLLASVSIFVARTLRDDDGRMLDLITELLPYRAEAVLAALRSFLAQAESVSGIAVMGFVVVSAITFFGVQESLFRIFEVETMPSLLRRLVTFSLLFFWGPLLVGSAQAGWLVLHEAKPEIWRLVHDSLLLRALPALVTFLGLSMLYWRAAFQRISLRHAAIGGAVATLLLELLKSSFGVYVRSFSETQRAVYGSFAIALFFVLSIQLAWYILLFAAEISSCLPKREGSRPAPELEPDPWTGLGALELLGAPGRPTLDAEELAPRLALTPAALAVHLAPLIDAGWLETADGYRLALPARQIRLAAVLAAFRRRTETQPAGVPPENTAALRLRLRQAIEFDVGEETLADLLQQPEPTGSEPSEAALGAAETGKQTAASLADGDTRG